jgi:hypothetical protein
LSIFYRNLARKQLSRIALRHSRYDSWNAQNFPTGFLFRQESEARTQLSWEMINRSPKDNQRSRADVELKFLSFRDRSRIALADEFKISNEIDSFL